MGKIIISFFALTLSFNIMAQTDIAQEKKKLIDTLLLQTGQSAIEMGKQFSNVFIQQMTAILKQTQPDINPKAFDILEEEVTAIIDEQLVQNSAFATMLYPIYDKHFNAEELQKMIELNNTEFGKKIIRVMPAITQEGMQAGQIWGQSIAPMIQQRIAQRFKAEGIEQP